MKNETFTMSISQFASFRRWEIIKHHSGWHDYSIIVDVKKDEFGGFMVTSQPIKTFRIKWFRKLHFKLLKYTFSIPMSDV